MKTVDIHAHLLNPQVRFDRLIDRFAVLLFAKSLGADPRELKSRPWESYVTSMARVVTESRLVGKCCLLGVDARVDRGGRELDRDPTVCASSEDVVRVARRYPDQFIPFLSVNPLRPNALDLIDEYVEKGCRGAKFLQNYWRVDPNAPSLIPYYEKLRRHNLPLIIHTGSEYTIQSQRELEDVGVLNLPLETGVTVVAAHMGLGHAEHRMFPWRNLSRDPACLGRSYFTLLEMLERHANLYADISAMLIPLRARALPHLARQTRIHHKILFGSDYPVPFTLRFNTHGLPRQKIRRLARIWNPLDRYTAAIMEFFPEHSPVFGNYRKVLKGE